MIPFFDTNKADIYWCGKCAILKVFCDKNVSEVFDLPYSRSIVRQNFFLFTIKGSCEISLSFWSSLFPTV